MEDKKKNNYSESELQEFKDIINKKLDDAKDELNYYQKQIVKYSEKMVESRSSGLDDGSGTLEKESLNKMASRFVKYIQHLENALIRIENKTYGICRETGELISRERLRVVPHTTLSIAAKKAKRNEK